MRVTEDEAIDKKICPIYDDTCLGSDCMAWRWSPQYSPDEEAVLELGYCGLAGEPEKLDDDE